VILNTLKAFIKTYFVRVGPLTWMFTMTDYSTNTGVEGHKVTNNNRRRSTDFAPSLDYVTKELVSEFIENQQQMTPPEKSFIQKLLQED